ncbi:(3R)-3-hydroxyacyl-CoA dehydrogenase-like [Ixodes scapularis]|uniref:(3R)-3-hydroxyacyl-CoA dehydrogenase-like n=1 Tax=Ixodes scapularis TaxID=6945 RepID=UPI001A9E6526|nr:(3R)-3-hydroxyacyl-CoA dehydrogenase-like [Ixodes scapularis]
MYSVSSTGESSGVGSDHVHRHEGSSSLQLGRRLALVTGGASGIGQSVAKVLAREGATVIVADINMTGTKETIKMLQDIMDSGHKGMYADVRRSADVETLFKDIRSAFPETNLSLVVNSAGILQTPTPVDRTSDDVFDNIVATNLRGTFLVTRESVKFMLANNVTDGAIVNIASIGGKGGLPGVAAYAASKGAVLAFTKSVARELGTKGIRLNAILPALTDTPMISQYPPELIRNRIMIDIPMQRKAEPIEISETSLFMLSPKSSFMTGASIDVAGGMYS